MLFAHLKRILKLNRLRLRGQKASAASERFNGVDKAVSAISIGTSSWSPDGRASWRSILMRGVILSGIFDEVRLVARLFR
ncbi:MULTISPECIES: hypothetical protein [Brevundimonas]|uniref:hypothetical protein n=1 Tax=Brevundimonas TaxID=41275 RepID=UPI000E66AE61|nr:hypothetical protein D1604_07645 [Brevundimonas sp. LPMIX5]